MKRHLLALLTTLALRQASGADLAPELDNGLVRLQIDLHGGAITNFSFAKDPLNPFSWKSEWNKGCQGFFLCFDRLAFPSKAEQKRGIPFHGEAHATDWTVLEKHLDDDGCQRMVLRCRLPLAGMSVTRTYRLFSNASVCRVTDVYRNDNAKEKPYNALLHPSLGPPFLDLNVIVDCSASTGFVCPKGVDAFPPDTFEWPRFRHDGKSTNLRGLDHGFGLVAAFRNPPDVSNAWACVANPKRGLAVGYLWETADYPWFNVWQKWNGAKPEALAVEFGTSAIGFPLKELVEAGPLFGLPIVQTLPPGGESTRSFLLFLANVPETYAGTERVRLDARGLILEERGNRRFRLPFRAKP